MQANTKLLFLLSLTSACSLIGKVVPIGTDTRDVNADRQRQADERDAETKRLDDGRQAWCKDFNLTVDVDLDKFKDIDHGETETDARKFGAVMCAAKGEHHELKPKVMEMRAAWMKRHGMDERDFLALVAGGDEQDFDKFDGPVGQIGQFRYRGGARLLDQMGTRASMLARVEYVKSCLDEGLSTSGEDGGFLERLICTREPLDKAKADAEIEAEKKLDPYSRTRLRQMVFNTVAKLAKARADLAAQAKDDPGIAEMVAIAEAQRKEWASITPERQTLIAELETMEAATAANKRSGFAGCEERTYPAWARVVKGVKITGATFEGTAYAVLPAVFRTADAYLAYKAMTLCAAGIGLTVQLDVDRPTTKRRGWRSATIAALASAHDSIKMDNKDHDRVVPKADYYISSANIADGTIAKLTPKGDLIKIEFKPELYKSNDCVESKATGQIDYYTNGTPFMKTVCVRHAIVQHDSSPADVSVDAFFAKGLKPGMVLLVTTDGFPIVAMNKREATASWVLGAPVN